MKLGFTRQIFSKFSSTNFMKIHSVWAELFGVDEQTERPTYIKKLIIVLRNFRNAPKNMTIQICCHTKILLLYWFLRTDQHFHTTLSEQCVARLVGNLLLHGRIRPWSCRQQFYQKINNFLLIGMASYPRRLDISCQERVSICYSICTLTNTDTLHNYVNRIKYIWKRIPCPVSMPFRENIA
jgi:hypothetical protein